MTPNEYADDYYTQYSTSILFEVRDRLEELIDSDGELLGPNGLCYYLKQTGIVSFSAYNFVGDYLEENGKGCSLLQLGVWTKEREQLAKELIQAIDKMLDNHASLRSIP